MEFNEGTKEQDASVGKMDAQTKDVEVPTSLLKPNVKSENGIKKDVKINPDVLLAVIQSPLFASQPGNIEELTGEMVEAAKKFTEALGDQQTTGL